MKMFARFGEIPAMTLQDIKRQNVTDGRTHGGQRENGIPATNTVAGCIINIHIIKTSRNITQYFDCNLSKGQLHPKSLWNFADIYSLS